VHFGAACLKRAEESSKFPIANFFLTFFLHFFKQLFNVLSDKNYNYIHNWSILVQDMIFEKIFTPEPQGKNTCSGEIFITTLF
jgi:hypothetical protein